MSIPPSIPLPHRLHNPPPLFLGRDAEKDQLRAAIARGPVAVTWGAGGLGKTSLVSATLFAHFAADTDRIATVTLRSALRENLATQIARPLFAANRVSGHLLLENLLDLAEANESWLVIEDLHKVDETQAEGLLDMLARYARRSRWLFTTRLRPACERLAGQLVHVGLLADSALAELARALAPGASPSVIDDAVARAAGSPWRLQQLSFKGVERPGTRSDLLAGIDPVAESCLEMMAILDQPMSSGLLGELTAATDDLLGELERRALVQRRGDRWEPHDVARHDLTDRMTADRRRQLVDRFRLLVAAPGTHDSLAITEQIRFDLEADHIDSVAATLARHGEALIEDGLAPELWARLRPSAHPALASWRLRLALDVAPSEWSALAPPGPDASLVDRLRWTRICFRRGDMAAAARYATEVAARSTEAAIRHQAQIILARTLLHTGEFDQAGELLATIDAAEPPVDCYRDAVMLDVLVSSGRHEQLGTLADRVVARSSQLRGAARSEVTRFAARPLYELGRLDDLERLLRGDGPAGGPTAMQEMGYEWVFGLGTIAADRGQIRVASALFDRLAPPRIPVATPVGAAVAAFRFGLRLGAGDLASLDPRILEAAAGSTDPLTRLYVTQLWHRYAIVAGIQPPGSLPDVPGAGSAVSRRLTELAQLEHVARWGKAVDIPGSTLAGPKLASDEARIRAIVALGDGQLAAARSFAERAVDVAQGSGFALREAESRQVLTEILVVARDHDRAADEAGRMAEVARRIESPRFETEARFLATAPADVDAATLLGIAAAGCAPVAERRIRVLLGDHRPIDRVDEQVVARLMTGWRWRAVRATADSPHQSWWVIDRARMAVTFATGDRVDLAASPLLLRVLDVLASRDAQATKLELLRDVWGVADYDPARHDNRLKTAVRKLRAAIEPDPGEPRWLVTHDDGYALGGWPIVSWA